MEYIDISPPISERTAVFPGDVSFRRTVSGNFGQENYLLVSKIESTVHIGAHTDAPSHYHPNGEAIHERSLEYYLGKCQVITVKLPRGARILPKHLEGVPIQARRVLFRTESFSDPNRWNSDFNSLSPELVEDLGKKGVLLVGIDTPSVDPSDSKALETHQAIHHYNLAILEGIVLNQVPDGIYLLCALPLKIEGADASPVRAILVPAKFKPASMGTEGILWNE